VHALEVLHDLHVPGGAVVALGAREVPLLQCN
jgi:hypothetical protein